LEQSEPPTERIGGCLHAQLEGHSNYKSTVLSTGWKSGSDSGFDFLPNDREQRERAPDLVILKVAELLEAGL
jgi:hypothetical protein